MKLSAKPTRNGFTLIEILAAIIILSILAGLVTLGGRAALRFFRGVNDKATIDNIAKALEIYKNRYGEYPPDGTDASSVRRHLLQRDPDLIKPTNTQQLRDLMGKLETIANTGQLLTYWLCGENWVEGGSQTGESEFLELKPGFSNPSEVGTVRSGINYNIASRTLCNAKGYPVIYFRANKTAKEGLTRWLHEGSSWSDEENYEPISYQNGEFFYNEVKDRRDWTPYADAEHAFDVENCGPYFSELVAGREALVGLHPYRHCQKHSKGLWFAPDTYQLILPGEDGLYVSDPENPNTVGAELDNVTNFCGKATMAEEKFEGRHQEHD